MFNVLPSLSFQELSDYPDIGLFANQLNVLITSIQHLN